jgi:hypothetical protein
VEWRAVEPKILLNVVADAFVLTVSSGIDFEVLQLLLSLEIATPGLRIDASQAFISVRSNAAGTSLGE